jgi:uncharacterized phage protein gp47/JayE
MPLVSPTYDDLLNTAKAALIANTTQALALADGDPLLALLQASVIGDLVVVEAVEALNSLIRAQTCVGSDLDDWLSDFDFPRLKAVFASGNITLALLTESANPITVPVGTQVSSAQSSAIYQVTPPIPTDVGYSYYVQNQLAYIFQPGPGSIPTTIDLPVKALQAGSAYNVLANTLTNLITSIPGASSPTNKSAISNGQDAESDQNYLSRFQLFLQSLHKGNRAAISLAVQNVMGEGADFALVENKDINGAKRSAYFLIIAEDGSGSLPSAMQQDISDSVDSARAMGVQFDCSGPIAYDGYTLGPTWLTCKVSVLLQALLGGQLGEVISAIKSAIGSYFGGLKIGNPVYYSELVNAVMDLQVQYPAILAVETVELIGGGGPGNSGDVVDGDYSTAWREVVRLRGEVGVEYKYV